MTVWLHSLVGRVSHRYRGGHRFKSPLKLRIFAGFFLCNSFNNSFTARIIGVTLISPQFKYHFAQIHFVIW